MIRNRKKLQLRSQEIRRLSDDQLTAVAGGRTTPTNDTFFECPKPPDAVGPLK